MPVHHPNAIAGRTHSQALLAVTPNERVCGRSTKGLCRVDQVHGRMLLRNQSRMRFDALLPFKMETYKTGRDERVEEYLGRSLPPLPLQSE